MPQQKCELQTQSPTHNLSSQVSQKSLGDTTEVQWISLDLGTSLKLSWYLPCKVNIKYMHCLRGG